MSVFFSLDCPPPLVVVVVVIRRCSLPPNLVADFRQTKRIVHPLVLGTTPNPLVYALGMLVVTSRSDIEPLVERRSRLFE